MPTPRAEIQRASESSFSQTEKHSSLSHPLASVSLLLATGGDKRIWPDAITGRNRYGTRTTPTYDEISFSSSTASNVSADGYAAADREWKRLTNSASPTAVAVDRWFDDTREQILRALSCTDAELIFAASGTDAELVALCLLASLSKRPLTNIFVAPDETGNGVPRAAAGLHFSDQTALGISIQPGTPIAGLSPGRIEVRSIALRHPNGEPRENYEIDGDLVATVSEEIKQDRDVIVHVLDTSKTGLTGVTREAARHVSALAPGRVRVIIDACQLRCPIAELRQDLADGFLVAITASKFIAAPPFAGALILPSAIVEELRTAANIPAGLADYTAALDWPQALRERMPLTFKSEMNLGLGLRWTSGLANLTRFSSTRSAHHDLIKAHFVGLIRSRVQGMAGVVLHDDDDGDHLVSRSIVPLTVLNSDGGFATFEEAAAMQACLRRDDNGPICHVGQPVRVGPRAALRVSASALDIAAASERMTMGLALEAACLPLESDLDIFFEKWATGRRCLQEL
ncbi:MAG: hypothetical protein JSR99_11270 [Proteobacteria bacterium]|nr:hypothetical protein [Pseudomonadota bacterium]